MQASMQVSMQRSIQSSIQSKPTPRYVRDARALTELQELVSRLRKERAAPRAQGVLSALQTRLARVQAKTRPGTELSPFERMNQCRVALERLDSKGWKRSYHQRLFHEDFLVRIFFYFFCLFVLKVSMVFIILEGFYYSRRVVFLYPGPPTHIKYARPHRTHAPTQHHLPPSQPLSPLHHRIHR